MFNFRIFKKLLSLGQCFELHFIPLIKLTKTPLLYSSLSSYLIETNIVLVLKISQRGWTGVLQIPVKKASNHKQKNEIYLQHHFNIHTLTFNLISTNKAFLNKSILIKTKAKKKEQYKNKHTKKTTTKETTPFDRHT